MWWHLAIRVILMMFVMHHADGALDGDAGTPAFRLMSATVSENVAVGFRCPVEFAELALESGVGLLYGVSPCVA